VAVNPPFQCGLLFAQNGAGAIYTGTTAASPTGAVLSRQDSTHSTPVLDAGYFFPGRSIRLVARGLISFANSATVQTLQMGFAFAGAGSAGTDTPGIPVAATGTITPATSQSLNNGRWWIQADITCTTAGAAGQFTGFGLFTVGLLTPTLGTQAGSGTVGVGSFAQPALSTLLPLYPQAYALWGTANASASNTMTCYQFFALALGP
jgi:hypothetical protein